MRTHFNHVNKLCICPIHHADILNGRILRTNHTDNNSRGTLIRCGIQRGKEKVSLNTLSGILPINSWVDLRTPEEYEPQFNSHDLPATIKYLALPIRFKPPENHLSHIVKQSDYVDLYFTMSTAAWSIAQTVTELLHAGNVVLHCNLGKDRTGLVAAAVLYQLKFSTADIAHDFALSARFLRRQYQLIQDKAQRNGVPNHLQARRYELLEHTIIPLFDEWTKITELNRSDHD
ncbi:tyrosine-protein phosphatase [Xenorhabdus bovienii]|uniref:Tyrosine-protein phosphatase n=1 Tax=Xenorhabdus bovienii TaxID=40576 RepID=A0AAJ1JB28_XENBV|nr:tyrosine-protein phosphatase [Xenorhabdus bovienii]MDE1480485.1 tyrosine-protein phosphatase [Xenorhabdus bovienii]MDE1488975.1 tyrosine-protein phosphatase [Xenorhabdus bovienii]MDE1492899.1 tyrosine-protein phosphatase [Xenorhabdus bovienii]MDE9428521.1 tyrosine-protein phosphatase [Xenorhabdus bovienii]MDE9467343.1 tyrosine-protein phosphatase [Xenorhabdus bovienii]